MLKAIFILLMIAFFPLTSLVLGVGLAALSINYWWALLLLAGLYVWADNWTASRPVKKPYFMD